MALMVLVMLLPNICTAISTQLPQIFFIFYRIICWKSPKTSEDENPEVPTEPTWPLGHRRESWDAASEPPAVPFANASSL